MLALAVQPASTLEFCLAPEGNAIRDFRSHSLARRNDHSSGQEGRPHSSGFSSSLDPAVYPDGKIVGHNELELRSRDVVFGSKKS